MLREVLIVASQHAPLVGIKRDSSYAGVFRSSLISFDFRKTVLIGSLYKYCKVTRNIFYALFLATFVWFVDARACF